ncbi:MAG: DUF3604 domain-containing protein [Deltaproteobacteria bacterium]|nr:DUF3604 domain-containing protein [Deltaproteobacteria bacterium]
MISARVWGGAVAAILAAGPLVASAQEAPERHAYFGESHVHTSWSFDAYIFGNTKTTPADAYKYAKGEPIPHPMGYPVKIETPLDWMGVTDHSEYAGVVQLANDPTSALGKLPIAKKLIVKTPADIQRIYLFLGETMIEQKPIPELVSPEVAGTVWKRNNAMADAANEPGKFTAFCSYEWTSTPDNRNMHRNVFFEDCAKVPELPFSSLESVDPTDLWAWMDGQRKAGNELIAISHNANLSDGHMFPIDVDEKGRPIDAAWAATRDRNERLTEIKQIKGQSETHPLLSPNDEFANYEILNYLLGFPEGRFPTIPGSYVRQGLKDGIAMQQARGYNPYKTGVVGGSDSHDTAVPYRQSNFFGGHGRNDGDIKERMAGHVFAGMDVRFENPAGLTGVWAEENTRASLFDAMWRKETFGTSGPQLKVRFFGGWEYGADATSASDWVGTGYAKGVPMGGDLPPAAAKAPTFLVWALKDPSSGNLDRIQIVKGWSASGQSFEKVYDVVWAGDRKPDAISGKVPAIGSTVDLAKATYTNSIGAVELATTWTDPDFDPSLDAFYYARVLEIPTPRWTTIQAAELGIPPPQEVPATVQERAWSSPIWYTPSAAARKTAKPGTTVADLQKQGATPLDDAALKALVVGKSTWLQNAVTGGRFLANWNVDGQRNLKYANPRVPQPSEVGDVAGDAYLGLSSGYRIAGGKIVTSLGNAPFSLAVYQLGDKYYGARSNEFGYANYEIIPAPSQLGSEVQFQLQ